MRYLQTLLKPSQRILHCVPIKPDNDGETEILMVFSSYAQVARLSISQSIVSIKLLESFPLSVPIQSIHVVGEHLAVITSEGQLIMLEKTPPFKRVSLHQLSNTLAPTENPIAHTHVTTSGECLVTAAFSKNVVVAFFDNLDRPTLHPFVIPKVIIISMCPTQDPDIFVFLVGVGQKRYAMHINIDQGEEIKRTEVDSDARKLVAAFNEDGYSTVVLFSCTKFIVLDAELAYNGSQFTLGAPYNSHYVTNAGEIVFQLANGEVFSFDPQSSNLRAHGSFPLIVNFYTLPNDLLVCVPSSSRPFVLPVIGSERLSGGSVGLDLLPRTEIQFDPIVTAVSIFDHRMIVCCGLFDSGAVAVMSNTIPIEVTPIAQIGISEDSLIYASNDGTLAFSTTTSSVLVDGPGRVQPPPSITFGVLGSRTLQIHRGGVCTLDGALEWRSTSVVTLGAVCLHHAAVYTSAEWLYIFDENLNVVSERSVPHVSTFTFCEDGLTVAIDAGEGAGSIISVYSLDLQPGDDVIQVPSTATEMLYTETNDDLVVATAAGTVFMFPSGYSGIPACLFNSKEQLQLVPVLGGVLIVCDKPFLYIDRPMSVILPSGYKRVSRGRTDDEVIVYTGGEVKSVKVLMTESDLTGQHFPIHSTGKVILDPSTVVVNTKRDGSSIVSFETRASSDRLSPRACIKKVSEGIVAYLSEDDLSLNIARYTEGNIETIQSFKFNHHLPTFDVANGEIYAIGFINPKEHRLFKISYSSDTDQWVTDEYMIESKDTTNSIMKVDRNRIWLLNRGMLILVFQLRDKMYRNILSEQFPKIISTFELIDSDKAVTGDIYGNIRVISLPVDVSTGQRWLAYSKFSTEASINVGEAITSLFVRNSVIYYSGLFGQIGALVPLQGDEEYKILCMAESAAEKLCAEESGMYAEKRFETGKLRIVRGEVVDRVGYMDSGVKEQFDQQVKAGHVAVAGILCSLRVQSKF